MKKKDNITQKFDSLSAIHKILGLPAPQHPLISFVNNENNRTDEFSRDIIIAKIDLLLYYRTRFYKRQLITRNTVNSDLLQSLDKIPNDYLNDGQASKMGAPTLQHLSEHLNRSTVYLSDRLRCLTRQTAQQHIQNKIIDSAIEKLSTTNLSLSAIAYELGFDHPESFSILLKMKTWLSPMAFRRSLN